ncbi:hypothetical protein FGG08_000928 [Glutinoglossum americanum]|uniref:Prefoldin subunit 5 n=1 Tax=Glutinoglossum americanum TaxID=1670608 RepID=A0A9P8IFR4_9PEZI|nr:hypothetical protein FGG08_000928 [Glutinoglossum americanum]
MATPPKEKSQAVDLTSLTLPQLSSVKKQLDDELEHLTSSFTKLRAAQVKFQECLRTIKAGVDDKMKELSHGRELKTIGKSILVPLTTSLYVPGTMADTENVIVDVGTGYYVEKVLPPPPPSPHLHTPYLSAGRICDVNMPSQNTKDATQFYNTKIEDLATSLKDLEAIIQGKSNNLRVVEDVLRQKVLSGSGGSAS